MSVQSIENQRWFNICGFITNDTKLQLNYLFKNLICSDAILFL